MQRGLFCARSEIVDAVIVETMLFLWYHESSNLNLAEVSLMIGNIVKVIVDRPLGTFHPKHKDIYYSVNYGYIPDVLASDGEEQDAYILGIDKPVKEFVGRVIAIIHRFDDVEEKWVVAPENSFYTKDEIMRLPALAVLSVTH